MGDIPLQLQKVDHSPPKKTLKGKVSVGAAVSALAHMASAQTKEQKWKISLFVNGSD